jgi:hypothetical protein
MRIRRPVAIRLTFTEEEWAIIEAQFSAVFPKSHQAISRGERMCYFRQAMLATALAIVRARQCPLPVAVDLRSKTAADLELEEMIKTGGDRPSGPRFDFSE